jgi:hypothetical protein
MLAGLVCQTLVTYHSQFVSEAIEGHSVGVSHQYFGVLPRGNGGHSANRAHRQEGLVVLLIWL